MATSDYTWNGTGLKFAVSMTCSGFDMDDDDWTITVTKGKTSIVFDKDSAVQDAQDNWYICIDSTLLGPGMAQIIFDAYVPDDDFEGGIRHEIQKYDLINIQRL